MRKLAGLSVSMMVLGLYVGALAVPASAQQYPPGGTTCGVGDTSIGPGDQITVSGSGFQPGSRVFFTLQPGDIEIGSTTVGPDGSFSVVLTIPSSVAPGSYSLSCSGLDVEGNPITRDNPIQVVGVVAGGPAFTGTSLNVPLWMALVAALLASGVLLVVLGGRRRRGVRAGP